MDEIEEILTENAKEYFLNAIEAESKKQYNSSVTLFFKAMSALGDLYILRKEGEVPSSHSNRFKTLKEKYSEIYRILDKDFPYYQDSYRSRLNKEISDLLKNDTKKLFEILKIKV